MISFEDPNGALRDALNARVSAAFERAWPAIYRDLSRMAQARWEAAPGSHRPRKWTIQTTPRLLEAPAPSAVERALGVAVAAIHVEARRPVRGAVEAWTVTLRAFADHDEVQVVGASSAMTRDISSQAIRRLLRAAALAGPGRYPVDATLPAPPAARSRPTDGAR